MKFRSCDGIYLPKCPEYDSIFDGSIPEGSFWFKDMSWLQEEELGKWKELWCFLPYDDPVLDHDAHIRTDKHGIPIEFKYSRRLKAHGLAQLVLAGTSTNSDNDEPWDEFDKKRPAWEWDGNIEKPTLNPSIRRLGSRNGDPDLWHGYITAGRIEACE